MAFVLNAESFEFLGFGIGARPESSSLDPAYVGHCLHDSWMASQPGPAHTNVLIQ